jgi:transposase
MRVGLAIDTALLTVIAELRSRASAKLGAPADVACCFETGRDGFWLHRLLTAHGVAAYVLEPTSILVNRRDGPRPIGSMPRACFAY